MSKERKPSTDVIIQAENAVVQQVSEIVLNPKRPDCVKDSYLNAVFQVRQVSLMARKITGTKR